MTLDDAANRSACYRCHPGSDTTLPARRDGQRSGAERSMLAMQCQSCHGSMSAVGRASRDRLARRTHLPELPHRHRDAATTARSASPTSSTPPGQYREARRRPLRHRTPTLPAPGSSLYRFSTGHGGLQCSACHGVDPRRSTRHRTATTTSRVTAIQGHAGTLVECADLPRLASPNTDHRRTARHAPGRG